MYMNDIITQNIQPYPKIKPREELLVKQKLLLNVYTICCIARLVYQYILTYVSPL